MMNDQIVPLIYSEYQDISVSVLSSLRECTTNA